MLPGWKRLVAQVVSNARTRLCGVALPLPRHRRHRRDYRFSDLILYREDVRYIAVVHICPLHDIVVGAAETRRHPQPIADALDGSLEHEVRRQACGAGGVAATS